jgi:uncharacterized lipoprotein
MKKISLALIPLMSIFVLGCSNEPTHIIVAPDLMNAANVNYINKSAQFSVSDMRIAQHVVQILREGEAAKLMNAQESMSHVVEQTLKKAFKQQGLVLSEQADNHIKIIINKALISVEQGMMSYEAKNELTLTIEIKNTKQTLTKKFSSKGTSDGPMSADIAVLERDFNQQLSKLLNRMLTNNEIISFIK